MGRKNNRRNSEYPKRLGFNPNKYIVKKRKSVNYKNGKYTLPANIACSKEQLDKTERSREHLDFLKIVDINSDIECPKGE